MAEPVRERLDLDALLSDLVAADPSDLWTGVTVYRVAMLARAYRDALKQLSRSETPWIDAQQIARRALAEDET